MCFSGAVASLQPSYELPWATLLQTHQRLFAHGENRGVGLQVDPGAAPHRLQTLHRDVGGVSEPQADHIQHAAAAELHRAESFTVGVATV